MSSDFRLPPRQSHRRKRDACQQNFNVETKLPSNQQYSVTALTDTTATIAERYAYDAYGKLSVFSGGGSVLSGSAYGNRYAYTGREWDDDLGLYHYRARMYSPESGRFVLRDPIGYFDGASLYRSYFILSSADPTGLKNCKMTGQKVVYGFRVHGIGPSIDSTGLSPNPISLQETFEIYCECATKTTTNYSCTARYEFPWHPCDIFGLGPKNVYVSTWTEKDVVWSGNGEKIPGKAMILGYTVPLLPLPGNGGIGVTMYEFSDSVDNVKAISKCRIHCSKTFRRMGMPGITLTEFPSKFETGNRR